MFRPWVCLLFVSLLLANQAVAIGCPHGHSFETSDSHSSRRHIHIGLYDHHHDDRTSPHDDHHPFHQDDDGPDDQQDDPLHSDDHSSHDHCVEIAKSDVVLAWDNDGALLEAKPDCGHECDAVYLVGQDDLFSQTSRLIKIELPRFLSCHIVARPHFPSPTCCPIAAMAGPFPHSHCALFLQILCLRI